MFGSSVIREGRWGDPNSSALFFFKGLIWQDAAIPPTGIKAFGRRTCLKCKYPNGSKASTERSENSVFGFFFYSCQKQKTIWIYFPCRQQNPRILLSWICWQTCVFMFCFCVFCNVFRLSHFNKYSEQRLDRSPASVCGSMTVNNKNTLAWI